MFKVASTTLGVIFLLAAGASSVALGQVSPAQAAKEEAIRRQEATIIMRTKLISAAEAMQNERPQEAATLYEEAYNLSLRVGTGVDAERREAIEGIAQAHLILARRANRNGDFRAAETHLQRILKVDPQNERALELKGVIDQALENLRGLEPSEDVRKRIPEIQEERIDMATKVQDARVLYGLGKYDEAEDILREVIEVDPTYSPAIRYLNIVREAQFKIEKQKRTTEYKDALVQVERAKQPPQDNKLLPSPNPFANTNIVYTSKGRQTIYSKLHRIELNEVYFDALPLSEVVRFLKEEAQKRDPEGEGINFMINPFIDSAGAVAAPTVDPNTGAVIPPPPVQEVDLANVTVRVNPPLNNVSLANVLDAVTKVADTPIKYSVEDYAVVFSQKLPEAVQMFTRTYKVNPNAFVQGLEGIYGVPFGNIQTGSQGGGGGGGGGGGLGGQGGSTGFTIPRVAFAQPSTGGGGGLGGGGGGGLGGGGGVGGGTGGFGVNFVSRTNEVLVVQDAVRAFFSAAGVNMLPPSTMFYNDRTGLLLVRAPYEDLDIVEKAIQVLNAIPPLINLKAKFVAITQTDRTALGFDWFLGNVTMNGGKIGLVGGSAPSFQGEPTFANPSGVFPGQTGGSIQFPSGNDEKVTSGVRNTVGAQGVDPIPALGTVTGLLTDPQFRVVIRALEQRDGVDLLSSPEVTTTSGRQAQVAVNEIVTVVTAPDLNQQGSGGTGGAVGGGLGTGGTGVGTTLEYTTQAIPFGPVLDVVPYVSADGFTIQMTIIPSLTEFLGYDDPGGFVPQAQSVSGNTVALPITAQLPLPRMRVRQVITTMTVWDGQTVVLGGLISEDVANRKDKVPMLGDIPFLGRLFRSESSETQRSNLVIFVTPTIIDPSGNRVHDENNLPYDPNQLPEQP